MNVQNVIEDFLVSAQRIDGLMKLGFSKNEIYQLVAPARTLGRRKDMLSLEESDRVQRLERILEHATRVFKNADKANLWLRRKNRALNGRVPIDLLISETGSQDAHDVLGRIEFGMYS